MRYVFLPFIAIILPLLATSCASRASSVAPVAVASSDYQDLSCDEARALLGSKRDIENALTRQQNNAALGDAAGVVLALIPIGSLFGADKSGELAIAKGEVDALERRITVGC